MIGTKNIENKKNYHERVPRHGGKKLVEQIRKTQLIDDPIIAIAVDNGLVKVENHNNSSHFCFLLSLAEKKTEKKNDPENKKMSFLATKQFLVLNKRNRRGVFIAKDLCEKEA